jgi:hypothetical protein
MRGQRHAPAAIYPGKQPVPIVQGHGWVPWPVWTGTENLAPSGIRSSDRPARSQSLYRLRYPAHPILQTYYQTYFLLWSWINNHPDAEDDVFISVSTYFGHHHAHHQENGTKWCPKHVETPINTSSFLHLVGYLFTFMIQDARSREINILLVLTGLLKVVTGNHASFEFIAAVYRIWRRMLQLVSNRVSEEDSASNLNLEFRLFIRCYG